MQFKQMQSGDPCEPEKGCTEDTANPKHDSTHQTYVSVYACINAERMSQLLLQAVVPLST